MEPDCRLSKYAEIFSGSRAGCRRVGALFRKLNNGDIMAVINTDLFVGAASIEAEASPRKFPIKGESFFGFQLDRIQLGMENGSAAQIYQILSERILSHLLDALREAVGDLDLGPLPYLPAHSTASPEAAGATLFSPSPSTAWAARSLCGGIGFSAPASPPIPSWLWLGWAWPSQFAGRTPPSHPSPQGSFPRFSGNFRISPSLSSPRVSPDGGS